jgi:hypothetical protein
LELVVHDHCAGYQPDRDGNDQGTGDEQASEEVVDGAPRQIFGPQQVQILALRGFRLPYQYRCVVDRGKANWVPLTIADSKTNDHVPRNQEAKDLNGPIGPQLVGLYVL